MNTWWKYNVATDRKEKLAVWKDGSGPHVTGPKYPIYDIDRLACEPEPLKNIDILARLRANAKYNKEVEHCEHIIVRAHAMTRFIHKLRWAVYRIGIFQADLIATVNHNKNQDDMQKYRRSMLGGQRRDHGEDHHSE